MQNKLRKYISFYVIIHKLVKVVYEKTANEDTIFVSENLRINIKAYLFA